MGTTSGLPVGLSFIGRPRSERALIDHAFAFERETRHRAAPRFVPAADD
jgi:amidase